MKENKVIPTNSGENFDLASAIFKDDSLKLRERVSFFDSILSQYKKAGDVSYLRVVDSPAGSEVFVLNSKTGERKRMLMFGSNNYLGLATHPHVKEKVLDAITKFGTGTGGPPFLNGYNTLTKELEERLAEMKSQESVMLFSSGFSANLGIVDAVMQNADYLIYDAFSHASLYDGVRLSRPRSKRFLHNSMQGLRDAIAEVNLVKHRDKYVAVEGVYSMDGDLAPLDKIAAECQKSDAILILDDAHGTGVLGRNGKGTAEHFGVEKEVDITMGTFSKAFALNGGFVGSSKDIIEYIRWFARPYMFSASMPPTTIAAAHAALDVIEDDPCLRERLFQNVDMLKSKLLSLGKGFEFHSESAIVILETPENMDIRKANRVFNDNGIFVNSVEFPAVDIGSEKFRISLMATHTTEQIDQLVEQVELIWELYESGSPDVCIS